MLNSSAQICIRHKCCIEPCQLPMKTHTVTLLSFIMLFTTLSCKSEIPQLILKVHLDSQKAVLVDSTMTVKYGPYDISSGKPDDSTMNGEYAITSMKEEDRSGEFGVRMNFCSRLKNLKTGEVRGYTVHEGLVHKVNVPSSHGCIREKTADAKAVFDIMKPIWEKNHKAVVVSITGDGTKLFSEKFGDLFVYDTDGKPLKFRREADGKLPDSFFEKRNLLSLFYYSNRKPTTDRNVWTLGVEGVKDRVKVTEYEAQFGQHINDPEDVARLRGKAKMDTGSANSIFNFK